MFLREQQRDTRSAGFWQIIRLRQKVLLPQKYGSKSLTESEFLTVQTGRLDSAAMEETFLQEKPEMVLDATHPYAAEVTVNIRTACEIRRQHITGC